MMNTHLPPLVPIRLHDVVTGRTGGSKPFTDHPAWARARRKKARILGLQPPPLPNLDRHDFPPQRLYIRTTGASCTDQAYDSPIRSVITALGMGPKGKSHVRSIIAAGPIKVADRLWERDQDISEDVRTPSLADILRAARELGAIKDFWAVTDYDSLVGAIATTGPVVITFPWYAEFLPEGELATSTGRASTPWGPLLGLTSMCVSGYSANGLIVRVEHTEPNWRRPSFRVLEDHLVSLLSEQGEAYAFDRADPMSPIALYS